MLLTAYIVSMYMHVGIHIGYMIKKDEKKRKTNDAKRRSRKCRNDMTSVSIKTESEVTCT